MNIKYTIKASPAKGYGVFAARELAPGTVIMTDKPAIHTEKQGPDLKEDHVLRAFERLSLQDQQRYLRLHEGHRPYKSKIFRIYKANSFGDDDASTELFLEISRFNHSCVPNAYMRDNDEGNKVVVALKPISEGDEIFISYLDSE